MKILRVCLAILYVPFTLIGFNYIAIQIVVSGYDYYFLVLLLASAIMLSFFVEYLIPYQKNWNTAHNDSVRDLLHACVNEAANSMSLILLPIIAAFVPHLNFWPDEWPIWGQLLLAVFISDLGITLVHYASHKNMFLWRFHAVHHSVKRMYGFNGLMKHPIHQAFETIGGTFPLVALGIPVEIAALLAFAIAVQLLLQHSNVDMKIGPLRYFLALAPLHRFHHIKRPIEGDVNFGLFTTIWDRMLGTAVYDADRIFTSEDLGIEKEPDYPTKYVAQMLKPFSRANDRVQ